MRKLRKNYDPNKIKAKGEYNSLPSMTVPDMNLSIAQLLQNHSRGIISDVQVGEPLYFDSEIPRINDLTEKDELKQELKDRHTQIQLTIDDELQERKEKQQKIKKDAESALKIKNEEKEK